MQPHLISHSATSTSLFSLLPPRTTHLPFISKPARLNCVTGDMSFYELLGIPVTGTLQEIKQAYKQLVRKYHPDVSPPGSVEDHTHKFILVQQAYETLSDPILRALYDQGLTTGIQTAPIYQEVEDKRKWRNNWQNQLSELKRRSKYKDDATQNSSSGAPTQRTRSHLNPYIDYSAN